jgi:Fe-Mn family superoxide dismutase
MKFVLPSLPYDYDALEPYIDARTMEIHHNKHHQAYISNLIAALDTCPEFQPTSVESLLINLANVPSDIREAVRNNAGGHYNHSLFWKIMKKDGGGKPVGLVASEINKTFGSFEEFQALFNARAKTVFGSGWAWLSVHNTTGKLVLTALPNQDSPLTYDETPIMGLDVWEHAYYLKYQNKRPDYITAWWHVINWDKVEENYLAATKY